MLHWLFSFQVVIVSLTRFGDGVEGARKKAVAPHWCRFDCHLCRCQCQRDSKVKSV